MSLTWLMILLLVMWTWLLHKNYAILSDCRKTLIYAHRILQILWHQCILSDQMPGILWKQFSYTQWVKMNAFLYTQISVVKWIIYSYEKFHSLFFWWGLIYCYAFKILPPSINTGLAEVLLPLYIFLKKKISFIN